MNIAVSRYSIAHQKKVGKIAAQWDGSVLYDDAEMILRSLIGHKAVVIAHTLTIAPRHRLNTRLLRKCPKDFSKSPKKGTFLASAKENVDAREDLLATEVQTLDMRVPLPGQSCMYQALLYQASGAQSGTR